MFAKDFDAATFRKRFDKNLENAFDIRMAVRQAKKYLLDYNASRQIIDLGNPLRWGDLSELRRLARSPFKTIWVEFNNRARRERLIEVFETKDIGGVAKPEEVFPRMAWLVETSQKQPSAHRATLILDIAPLPEHTEAFFVADEYSYCEGPAVLPFSWWWDTEDSPSNPWGHSSLITMKSDAFIQRDFSDIKTRLDVIELAMGKVDFTDPFIGLTNGYAKRVAVTRAYNKLSGEFAGELRYIMAFVASLTATEIIKQSSVAVGLTKHASGQTFPAFEYTEVKITVPKRRKLSTLIANHGHSGVKMRDHPVSGSWRTYEHGTGPFCDGQQHKWELGSVPNKQNCTKCPAWRTWVADHRRGDKLLGTIEHASKVVT